MSLLKNEVWDLVEGAVPNKQSSGLENLKTRQLLLAIVGQRL